MSHHFLGGQPCDETGQPRSTHVKFECCATASRKQDNVNSEDAAADAQAAAQAAAAAVQEHKGDPAMMQKAAQAAAQAVHARRAEASKRRRAKGTAGMLIVIRDVISYSWQ